MIVKRSMYLHQFIGIASLVLLLSLSSTGKADESVEVCSVVELLSNSKHFDGKRVRTVGFASLAFEESALYLSEADARHRIYTNAIWLDLSSLAKEAGSPSGGYVEVEGVFDASHGGHLGAWRGAIKDISSFRPWK